MMSANEKKVLIVLVGTIRIEYSLRVGWGGERRDGKRGDGGDIRLGRQLFTGFATQNHPRPRILCFSPCLSH
jgi:hypothetical protein